MEYYVSGSSSIRNLLENVHSLLEMESINLKDYESAIKEVRDQISILDSTLESFGSSVPTVPLEGDQNSLEDLKLEKESLISQEQQIDNQLYKMIAHLRRLMLTLDSSDPTAFQIPTVEPIISHR